MYILILFSLNILSCYSKYIIQYEDYVKNNYHFDYKKITNEYLLINDIDYDILKNNKNIKFIEKDIILKKNNICNPSWGIDRINQENLPLDNNYLFETTDSSLIDIYVIDTGIDIDHEEFNHKKPTLLQSFGSDNPNDCDGHGTHVAGIIGGKNTGISSNANLFSIKIDHDCNGNAYCSDMVQAINLVIDRMKQTNRKSVINLSFGVCVSVVNQLNIFMNNGGIVSLAAGNDGIDISNVVEYQIFNINKGFIVGSTNKNDKLSYFSNYGTNVYMYAPGFNILSADFSDNDKCIELSGTSMSTPFVSGIIAIYWNKYHYNKNDLIIYNLLKFSNKNKIITNKNIRNNLITLPNTFEENKDISNFSIFVVCVFIIIICGILCICFKNSNQRNFFNAPNNIIDVNNNIDEDINENSRSNSEGYDNYNISMKNQHVIPNFSMEGQDEISIDIDLQNNIKPVYDNNFINENTPVAYQ